MPDNKNTLISSVQNLLVFANALIEKNTEILNAYGGRFNIFEIVGVNHYETIHSVVLAELLNPSGSHSLNDEFLRAFLDIIGLKDFINSEKAFVKTEVDANKNGRIDILIESERKAIIIENKIYAKDQDEQLKRYNDWANTRYGKDRYKILYLTLDGNGASIQSSGDILYQCISYQKDILKWLERCVGLAARYPTVRETINQYIILIKKLTNQNMDKILSEEIENLIISSKGGFLAANAISESTFSVRGKLIEIYLEPKLDEIAKEYGFKIKKEYYLQNQNIQNQKDDYKITFYKEEWPYKIYFEAGAFGLIQYRWKILDLNEHEIKGEKFSNYSNWDTEAFGQIIEDKGESLSLEIRHHVDVANNIIIELINNKTPINSSLLMKKLDEF